MFIGVTCTRPENRFSLWQESWEYLTDLAARTELLSFSSYACLRYPTRCRQHEISTTDLFSTLILPKIANAVKPSSSFICQCPKNCNVLPGKNITRDPLPWLSSVTCFDLKDILLAYIKGLLTESSLWAPKSSGLLGACAINWNTRIRISKTSQHSEAYLTLVFFTLVLIGTRS